MDNNVKKIRQERGMTQEELSIKSGVARSIISALESGHTDSVTTRTMSKLADALEVPVLHIFFTD